KWKVARARGCSTAIAGSLSARHIGSHRHAHWLRHQPVRRLHGYLKRAFGEVLHAARGAGRWSRDSHRGGAGKERDTASLAARVLGKAWPAMWILHTRHVDVGLQSAQSQSRPLGG